MATNRLLPPPECCEPLASLVTRFGGSVEIRSAAARVEYDLPPHATAEIREYWRAESQIEIAPGIVARLPGGRVFGAGIVLAPDGKSIARDVSLDFGKPFEEHWLLTSDMLVPPEWIGGSTAVIATNLGTGYGHWLLDELPRLLVLRRSEADTLIAHASQPFTGAALGQLGWTGTVLQMDRRTHFQCEQLVVPGFSSTLGHPTPHGLGLITEFTAAFHSGTSAFGERIYVTREQARRRKISNEAELWSELQAAGFAKVRLEELTWPEQINAFRHAKVVVAPHGAGLANLVFCRPGTRAVEIFNRSYLHGCFWRLAALQGLDYRPVVPDAAEPLAQATASNRLDIVADLRQVRAALR